METLNRRRENNRRVVDEKQVGLYPFAEFLVHQLLLFFSAELAASLRDGFFGLPLAGLLQSGLKKVPLVDDEHGRFVILRDEVTELFVDLADSLTGIEKHQHHVGPADTPLCPPASVKVDITFQALSLAKSWCVDCQECLSIQLESHVDTVACSPRYLAHDQPLGLGQ